MLTTLGLKRLNWTTPAKSQSRRKPDVACVTFSKLAWFTLLSAGCIRAGVKVEDKIPEGGPGETDITAADTDTAEVTGPDTDAPPDTALPCVAESFEPRAILVDDQGFLVGGDVWQGGSNWRAVVARVGFDGHLDRSFGSDGLALVAFPQSGAESTYDTVRSLARDSGGGIMVGAEANWSYPANLHAADGMALIDATGMPDARFGDGGVVVTEWPDQPLEPSYRLSAVSHLFQRPEGWLTLSIDGIGPPTYHAVRASRHSVSGALDTTFADGSQVGAVQMLDDGIVPDFAIADEDGVVFGGSGGAGGWPVMRMTWNGLLDAGFGEGGRLTRPESRVTGRRVDLTAGIEDNDAFILGGIAVTPNGTTLLFERRDRHSGAVDRSFGTAGSLSVDVPLSEHGLTSIHGLGRGSDGALYVYLGYPRPDSSDQFYGWKTMIVKIQPNGRLDPNWNDGGVLRLIGVDPDWNPRNVSQSGRLVMAAGSVWVADYRAFPYVGPGCFVLDRVAP